MPRKTSFRDTEKKLLAQFKFDSQVPIEAFVKGLHERPARVCKEPGFDNFQPGEGFGDEVEHGIR
jgi:hypothetical protein